MKGPFLSLLSAAALTVVMSSCSTSGKYFQLGTSAGGYHTAPVVKAPKSAGNDEVVMSPAVEAVAPVSATASASVAEPLVAASRALQVTPADAGIAAADQAMPIAKQAKLEKKVAKLAAKLEKRAAKASAKPGATKAAGKSQLIATLLCFFLGGFGVHRFYLGYTGRGILYIALALTSFLILPGIALFVLVIIDFIRILLGKLKPKGGEYAETF